MSEILLKLLRTCSQALMAVGALNTPITLWSLRIGREGIMRLVLEEAPHKAFAKPGKSHMLKDFFGPDKVEDHIDILDVCLNALYKDDELYNEITDMSIQIGHDESKATFHIRSENKYYTLKADHKAS